MSANLQPADETNQGADLNYYKRAARNFYISIPFYALVPLFFWWLFSQIGVSFNQSAFWYGALGWIIALVLRIPLTLVVKGLPKDKMNNIIISASGPLEEGVRVVLLLITGMSFSWGASLGQGWAAIEVLYTLVSGMATATLMTRTDEKAMQAKAILEQQMGGKKTTNPLYGISERLFASGLHIGSTLLLAFNPWFVLLTIVYHSLTNMMVVRLAKKSFRLASLVTVCMGSIIFIVATLIWLV